MLVILADGLSPPVVVVVFVKTKAGWFGKFFHLPAIPLVEVL